MARPEGQKLSARQAKIAAIRAEEERRRRRILLSVGAIGAVVLVVVALVVVKTTQGSSPAPSAQQVSAKAASRQVTKAIARIPASVFDKIGAGTRVAPTPPQPIKGSRPLTAAGKPRVLYAGAEYCPYCAAERWAVVAALSRFGAFHGLGETSSSARDVYPSTATVSFHGATYTSRYLAFSGYEMQSNKVQGSSYAPLDKLPASDQRLFQTYDTAPYVPSQSAGSIPFVDLGGKYLISGASYDPGVLKGMSQLQIARALWDPGSPVAQNVDATANYVTAALCSATHDQPADVCASSGVTAAAKKLAGS